MNGLPDLVGTGIHPHSAVQMQSNNYDTTDNGHSRRWTDPETNAVGLARIVLRLSDMLAYPTWTLRRQAGGRLGICSRACWREDPVYPDTMDQDAET